MSSGEHLAILKKGVEVLNAWRDQNPGIHPSFAQSDLRGVDLTGANLMHADLTNADLREASLTLANLSSANLTGANLKGVDLAGADLSAVVLEDANLRGTVLRGSTLKAANLSRADLTAADLSRVDLAYADISEGDLSDADLTGAFLRGVNFQVAKLKRTDFEGAYVGWTLFAKVDLSDSMGLETVAHIGPSTVDHGTLALSHGNLSSEFLEGCGFQDWEIESVRLHRGEISEEEITDITYQICRLRGKTPIQISPLFVSYSHKDTAFVEALEHRLDAERIRYWRDVHEMTAGPMENQIECGIRLNPTFVLVLSKNSVNSKWVEWEATKARELEIDLEVKGRCRCVLCPITLDDSWKTASWSGALRMAITKYYMVDFSGWQDSRRFVAQFRRLLDGLGVYYLQSAAR